MYTILDTDLGQWLHSLIHRSLAKFGTLSLHGKWRRAKKIHFHNPASAYSYHIYIYILSTSIVYIYIISTSICISGFATDCPCGVWGRCPLYVGPIFWRSILNKLVCKLNRIENSFSLSYEYALIIILNIYHHLNMTDRHICCILRFFYTRWMFDGI